MVIQNGPVLLSLVDYQDEAMRILGQKTPEVHWNFELKIHKLCELTNSQIVYWNKQTLTNVMQIVSHQSVK